MPALYQSSQQELRDNAAIQPMVADCCLTLLLNESQRSNWGRTRVVERELDETAPS